MNNISKYWKEKKKKKPYKPDLHTQWKCLLNWRLNKDICRHTKIQGTHLWNACTTRNVKGNSLDRMKMTPDDNFYTKAWREANMVIVLIHVYKFSY